ncbi:MAG TPA: class I SAM-dependent methyltransferase [Gemmatirosa sp.]
MRFLDRVLQRWRIARASPWLAPGAEVLDVGCADGALFRHLRRLGAGLGVEPTLAAPRTVGRSELRPGLVPDAVPPGRTFDAVTLLAVLEHVPTASQRSLAEACAALVRPGGVAIVTVPAPAVDHVLAVLRRLRLVDGMSLEEHFGFEPDDVPRVFAAPHWHLVRHQRFQLGLNNLFVFERT